jgi:hypothetical protein
VIRLLKSSDSSNFLQYTKRYNSDFYIFKDNKRHFLTDYKVSKEVFTSCLKRGNKAILQEENGELK